MSFSSFDVYEMVHELQDLVGMRVNTIYQIDGDLRIKLFGKGRKDIAITKEAFYVTKYPRPAPKTAKSFAMLLRKYLRGLQLDGMIQVNFDRVVEFRFGDYVLVAELFGKGNIILHTGGVILGVLRREEWKGRILHPHETYRYPPTRLPVDVSFEDFQKVNIQSEKDLAVHFNVGKLYAQEIFLRSQTGRPEDLYTAMHSFVKCPNIAGDDVVPYDLLVFKEREKEYFSTFTEAVDEYYKRRMPEGEEGEECDIILESQVEALKDFEKKKAEYTTCGNLIYENYALVQDILHTLLKARETHEWGEIIHTIKKSTNPAAQKILNIDTATGKVTVDLGNPVTVDITLGINENAASYYEMAKKMEKKIEGVKKAIEIRKKKEIRKEKKEEKIRILRKREWYEKFHWCFSSDGFLMLGGRDKKSNEILIKKYMEPTDLYVHADIQGAPSVLIKKGKDASPKVIEEAAGMAAAYSSGWNHFGSLECYWVYPDQVTKTPPSGEYLTPGAFFISGAKNFLTVALEVSLGVYEDKIMAGPQSAVEVHTRNYVKIGFGDEKKERLAKYISRLLEYSDVDEIVRALPGKGRVLHKE